MEMSSRYFNCNNCEYINITEDDQNECIFKIPHKCLKYHKQVYHYRHNGIINNYIIMPCTECMKENCLDKNDIEYEIEFVKVLDNKIEL